MPLIARLTRFFSDQSVVPKGSCVGSWFAAAMVVNTYFPAIAFAQQGPASVVVADVLRFDVSARQSFVGNVVANRRVIVGSAVDGRVLDSPIKAGQAIATRDTLALVRTVTIEIEIEAARAELELRTAELEELQNGSRPEEIRLAEASLEAAEALQDYAKTKFSRSERLIGSGSRFKIFVTQVGKIRQDLCRR